MHSLLSWALPLALAGSAIANPLIQRGDACLAAVTGRAALGDDHLRKSHCSSFIKTIVTPSAKTVTVTITSAPSPANNGWGSGWKRDVTVCPNEVPNYASACDPAAYKSACSVWGVKGDTTFTIPASTTTKTVYANGGSNGNSGSNGNNGFGGFGGQGGLCTSTKTNVITATTTVSGCSGGTTTKTVMSTSTSVSTAVSTTTLTVGNAPQITFTTTTTSSVGTVTSTVTSTKTSVVGAGSIGTSTVTTTSTASLVTTSTATTTVTVGASSTATVSTTVTLASTSTMTETDTTTVTDPASTTTMTVAITANNTVVVTSTVAAPDAATVTSTVTVAANATADPASTTTMTTTVTVDGTTGSTGTPSTGNCLNADQAQTFVDAFKDLLEYTSYNGTSAPPGRGYHYNVSATYLAADFQDYSDSINWMAGYNLGTVTFPSRDAFDYGQGLLQPELTMTTLNVDFGCKTVHWRWSALTSSYAHVTGVNYFTITDDLTQIQTNFAEFNNANWIQSFSAFNPSISCVVPGGLTAAQKRSLPRSY